MIDMGMERLMCTTGLPQPLATQLCRGPVLGDPEPQFDFERCLQERHLLSRAGGRSASWASSALYATSSVSPSDSALRSNRRASRASERAHCTSSATST